jgi:enolase
LGREARTLDAASLTEELERWCDRHPVLSLEDMLSEDDWAGWVEATSRLGSRVQTSETTSSPPMSTGSSAGSASASRTPPRRAEQVGTLSGAQAVVRRADEAGYRAIVSARSGDTEAAWLEDLAVGWGVGQIKVGSPTRSERTAKWNRLLRIEAELGSDARFAGATWATRS